MFLYKLDCVHVPEYLVGPWGTRFCSCGLSVFMPGAIALLPVVSGTDVLARFTGCEGSTSRYFFNWCCINLSVELICGYAHSLATQPREE